MDWWGWISAAAVSLLVGLDRTALLQLMLARPLVAGPLTGWLLGDPMTGLGLGALLELLWLGRLPVGAAIPPDDSQVTVAATSLAILLGPAWGYEGWSFSLLALLVTLPLGKVGQLADRLARQYNQALVVSAERGLAAGDERCIERLHWQGALHFALASLGTYLVIVVLGAPLLKLLAPMLLAPVDMAGGWLRLLFPILGVALILVSINVSRALTLFSASFATAMLMLWLM